MAGLKTIVTRTLLAGSAAAAFAAFTVPASAQQNEIPQGWFKVCSKQEDNDFCNVQNVKMAETGQLLTGLSLIDLKGKINKRIFQVSVPTGRLIPPGIGMQIDGGKPAKMDYVICFPDRCVAEAPLTDGVLAALRKGGELTLTSVNFQNQPSPIKVSLAGFSEAYDGAGLKQNELEDRQKKLQDEIEKRKGDFEKKLKEEQEKAKAAN